MLLLRIAQLNYVVLCVSIQSVVNPRKITDCGQKHLATLNCHMETTASLVNRPRQHYLDMTGQHETEERM